MAHRILLASAAERAEGPDAGADGHRLVGQLVHDLFEGEGNDVRTVNPAGPAGGEGLVRDCDLCVAFWNSREDCPIELLREFQRVNPRGYLVCVPGGDDPWVSSFLLSGGVTPDAVIEAPALAADVVLEAERLLALELADPCERLVVCVDDDMGFLYSLEKALPARLAARAPFRTTFEFLNDPTDVENVIADYEASGTPVAMIVTDHVMPELTGVELLAKAKELVPFAVRVLLTGQAGMDSVVTAVNNSTLDHYVSKPIENMGEFAQTLSHLLREYDLSARNRLGAQQTSQQYQFLKTLAQHRTLGETLQAVVSFVAHALDAERVSLMLCDGADLTIRAAVGLPEEVIHSATVPVGSGVAGRVFENGVPLYVTDASQIGADSAVESSYAVFASVPLLIAPMTVARRPLGIINVTDRRQDRPLSRGEMMFLSQTADAAAIAISSRLAHEQREAANFGAVRSLAMAVEAKDKYTRGHSERVALYAVQIAERLGIGPDEIEVIERAAIMHDIGKIGVPESVIRKPDRLTEAEFAHIRRHPEAGERIVAHLAFMADGLATIRGHHERLDGSGYPDGLAGDEIGISARIVAVADSYDAMTSERPYRAAMTYAEAVAELRRCAGNELDPRCVEALVEALEDSWLPCSKGGNRVTQEA